ncbi:MAG: HDIG domain-containing protein [Deltaproteobacteria bacterium]|nr:HDIG domain-containing protein [Deltaproteobacteria bacterium]
MIAREEALDLLGRHVKERNLIQHSLASEAVMRELAGRLDQDVDIWGLTGLLHDIDYTETADDPARHGLIGAEMLAGQLPEEAIQAIRAHNGERNGHRPVADLDFALRCGETVTGLITASALVRPTGMDGMVPKGLKKKMKDKAFAASVCRDNIHECERIGLDLTEFLNIAIKGMAAVATDIGLTDRGGANV